MKLKDSKLLMDSINETKKKIMDAEIDLTKPGIHSIANALLEKKEAINATTSFAELRDIMKEVVKNFDTPKGREILLKIEELNRLYNRAPENKRNDYYCWDRLLKYCYNILLKASGNPSPDAKPTEAEDSCKAKDEENEVDQLARLLGEAHDKIQEAKDLSESLENDGIINSSLGYKLEDLEADLSELDFMGNEDPGSKLIEEFGEEVTERWDIDEEDFEEEN